MSWVFETPPPPQPLTAADYCIYLLVLPTIEMALYFPLVWGLVLWAEN